VSSGREFNAKIDTENSFYDNEEIDCKFDYDDRKDDFTLNSRDENFSVDHDFTEDTKLDCSKTLDKITLTITDSENVIIYQKIFLNSYGFKYDLDTVDEKRQYFTINLKDHDFHLTGKVDCDLTIDDDYLYKYKFDKDTKYKDLNISRNFNKKISFDCDEQLQKIFFDVYDSNGDKKFSEKYENENNFNYDVNGIKTNHFSIRVNNDFAENDEIKCDLRIDKDDNEKYIFDINTQRSDLGIDKDFTKDFDFDCNSKIDSIEVTSYNSKYEIVDNLEYNNKDRVEYTFNQGDYGFLLDITHEFKNSNDKIRCDLDIDDESTIRYEFTKSSKLSDLRIDDKFEDDFTFDCNDDMDEFNLRVFDESNDDDVLVFNKIYKNTDKINFNKDQILNAGVEIEDQHGIREESNEEKNNTEENNTNNDTVNENNNDNLPVFENNNSSVKNNNSVNLENQTNSNSTNQASEPEKKNQTDITWIVVGSGIGIVAVLGIAVFMLLI